MPTPPFDLAPYRAALAATFGLTLLLLCSSAAAEPITQVSELAGSWVSGDDRVSLAMEIAADGSYVATSKIRETDAEGCVTHGRFTFEDGVLDVEDTEKGAKALYDTIGNRLDAEKKVGKRVRDAMTPGYPRPKYDLGTYLRGCVQFDPGVSLETLRADTSWVDDGWCRSATAEYAKRYGSFLTDQREAIREAAALIHEIKVLRGELEGRCFVKPGGMRVLPIYPDPKGGAYFGWVTRGWLIGEFAGDGALMVLKRKGTPGPARLAAKGEARTRLTGRWIVRGGDPWSESSYGALEVDGEGRFVWRWSSGCVVKGVVERADLKGVTFRRKRGTTCKRVPAKWSRKARNAAGDHYMFYGSGDHGEQRLARMTP